MSIELTAYELRDKIDNGDDFILIDVREPYELNICRIQHTKYIHMKDVEKYFDHLGKDVNYVIVCRSGARSLLIQFAMKNAGFSSVKNLKGGILSWIDNIDPTMRKY